MQIGIEEMPYEEESALSACHGRHTQVPALDHLPLACTTAPFFTYKAKKASF
jgi:hypothetical protein